LNEYQSKEFVSCCFNPRNEQSDLITLTGEPDWQLIFWRWNKLKIVAKISIGLNGPQPSNTFQCSFNPHDHSNVSIVVTGPNTYKYYKLKEEEFVADHTQVNNKDR